MEMRLDRIVVESDKHTYIHHAPFSSLKKRGRKNLSKKSSLISSLVNLFAYTAPLPFRWPSSSLHQIRTSSPASFPFLLPRRMAPLFFRTSESPCRGLIVGVIVVLVIMAMMIITTVGTIHLASLYSFSPLSSPPKINPCVYVFNINNAPTRAIKQICRRSTHRFTCCVQPIAVPVDGKRPNISMVAPNVH